MSVHDFIESRALRIATASFTRLRAIA